MNNMAIVVGFAASIAMSGCSNSETTMQLAGAPMELMKQCQTNLDVAACDEAIALFERNIPILKDRCESGDQIACGLFPGYDSSPQILRQFKTNCIEFEPGASFQGTEREAAIEGLKAGCSRPDIRAK